MDPTHDGIVTLVNPVGEPAAQESTLAARLPTLSGRTLCLINTGKPSIEHFLGEIESLMRAQFPDIRIRNARKDFTSAKPIAHEIDGSVEAAVSAWGD
jgi:hypothetical protein